MNARTQVFEMVSFSSCYVINTKHVLLTLLLLFTLTGPRGSPSGGSSVLFVPFLALPPHPWKISLQTGRKLLCRNSWISRCGLWIHRLDLCNYELIKWCFWNKTKYYFSISRFVAVLKNWIKWSTRKHLHSVNVCGLVSMRLRVNPGQATFHWPFIK